MPFDGDSEIIEGEVRWLFRKDTRYLVEKRREQARAAIVALARLEKLFDGGRHWIRRRETDGQGNYCLSGGLAALRPAGAKSNQAGRYLEQAIADLRRWPMSIPMYNDTCAGFPDIKAVIHLARVIARADA
jgi:hypothetical protein